MTNNPAIQPYLFFDGKCEEALEFYKHALGAKVGQVFRYKDSPEKPPGGLPPGSENKIMHASFQVGESVVLVSDGHCKGNPKFEGCSLSLNLKSEAEVDKTYQALSEGGQAQMPPTRTFFSARFGMLIDKFGVMWMLLVTPQH